MSAPIGPGDWVECIARGEPDDPQTWMFDFDAPRVSRVYLVDGIGAYGLFLTEFRRIDPEWGGRVQWCADCFRPIYRPKSEIIEALKQPAPERALEDA